MAATVFADVAVPLPIHQLFSYLVPDALQADARPGVRVLVPFGNRRLIGILVRVHEEANAPSGDGLQLKPVFSVLDRVPLIGPRLLELGAWVSSYYLAPPGEAFRVMLPPGLLARSVMTDQEHCWPLRKQLAVVRVTSGSETALSSKQEQAFEKVKAASLPLLLAEALQLGCTSAVLRTLAAKGLLEIATVEVERSPWSTVHVQPGEVRRHVLNEEQRSAFSQIEQALSAGSFRSLVLHGVTGSGKTEVYLNAVNEALGRRRTALLLVPEIGLTPQVARYFQTWFKNEAAILHSGLSDGERFDQWLRIKQGDSRVVIGTRSAVFAPLENPGLLIVDEEHDGSYKQEETPRYHARDTAIKRAQLENAVVVLGSATPQLETYYLATSRGQHGYHRLASRIQERPLPTVRLVDMRIEFQNRGRAAVISQILEDSIRLRLEQGQQVLVLLNRRGYSPLLLCRSCGSTEACNQCSISLTYHQESKRLCCHYCGYSRAVPKSCANCGKQYLFFVGEGTERIEELLRERFPEARLARLDRDTVQRRGRMTGILSEFAAGNIDLLVGTQMIAKGHDFPGVTLVGVLAAEQSLRLADFRSAERTFQLLLQVAGRAGRGDQPGEVIIQSYFPNHYSVKYACAQDYARFFQEEIEFRRRFRYPPFAALANIIITGKDRGRTEQLSSDVLRVLTEERRLWSHEERMRFLGPAPAARERLRGDFRFQILVKTTSRPELHRVLEATLTRAKDIEGQGKGISVDVDPVNLL
ncbi:MAG: primosomal protein N' [Acidobacteria bacterium]|nr:MAG: primosomal protein N' [Acidobacteriota bacterium]